MRKIVRKLIERRRGSFSSLFFSGYHPTACSNLPKGLEARQVCNWQ
jgi:hypothetical protein